MKFYVLLIIMFIYNFYDQAINYAVIKVLLFEIYVNIILQYIIYLYINIKNVFFYYSYYI